MTRSTRSLVIAAGFATIIAPVLFAPPEAAAQRRAVRRPPVRSVVHVPVRSYRPVYYYAPYYGLGLHGGWYTGWYGPYPYSFYGHPYPYPYRYRAYDYRASARIQVQPKSAEVFIDGYFVGVVDDFDGWSQRLHLEPGEHELQIHLEGYRTYRRNVLFRPGATLKIEHVLQPLAAGDPPEPRPIPSSTPAQARPDPYGTPPPRRDGPSPGRTPPAVAVESREYGAVAVRVQPADAEVVVDGERWESPGAGDLTLQLSEGAHRVEVRRDGYRPYTAEIRVRRGETTSLNVSLTRQ